MIDNLKELNRKGISSIRFGSLPRLAIPFGVGAKGRESMRETEGKRKR